ncbi:hypothetical protein C7476_12927 [Phyllobacterium bourgognense]|uniref:Uncharacterized protein n=1 Tax=Phyllobacterium bourgognense TaxID=314236 RepID=A0A368YEQ6_9HYPH|nr:hypothetical protein C7476_12927 [Phyllobacterium bourgognense]
MRTEFEEGPEDERKEPPLYLYELEFLVEPAITTANSRLLYLGYLRADGPKNAVHAIDSVWWLNQRGTKSLSRSCIPAETVRPWP